MEQQTERSRAQKVGLIFWVYLKSMLFAFTGGSVTLPLLQQQLGDKYGLIDRDKVLEYFALSQAIPGVISLNAGIFIGREIAGWPGAFAAVLGTVLPGFFGMLLITASYTLLSGLTFISGAIGGIRAASVAIILLTAINILGASKKAFGLVMAGLAFVLTVVLGWNIILVVLLCGMAGVAREWLLRRRKGAGA